MSDFTFPIGDLLRPGSKTDELVHQLDLVLAELDPDLKPQSNLKASLTLRKVGDSIGALLTDGEVVLELACTRCLAGFTHPLSLEPTERYFYLPGQMPAEEEGEEFLIAEDGGNIDISELLRQEIILALPPYSLCPKKCRGICGQCGRKDKSCRCPVKPPRPDPNPTHNPLANLSQLWQDQAHTEE